MNRDPSPISPEGLNFRQWVVVSLLCGCAATLLYARFTSDSSTLRFLIEQALGTDRSADLAPFRDEDARWRATSGGRPIALSFIGFRSDDPMDRFFVAQRYFRCVYAVFPEAVYVASEGVIINDARPLIESPLDVDVARRQFPGVAAHVLIEKRPDGSVDTRLVQAEGERP